MRIDDPAHVQAQYVTEENLETRRSVWHPTADGRDPTTEALDAIVADNPLRVLEVGPGTGMFAVRLAAALPAASVTTIDQSARFVEMTRARGVDSRVGDAQDLPYADESFDAVAALWMLYHVPDIERAIAEVRRVLAPGGRFLSLDFNRPTGALVRTAYLAYLTVVGSALGLALHGDADSYRYIPESIRRYPGADGVAALLRDAGFDDVRAIPVFGGLMAIHTARVG